MNGSPFTIRGVGYAPTPIGIDPEDTPPYGDYFAPGYSPFYNRDLQLLRQMGTNTLRLWGWRSDIGHSEFLDAAYNQGKAPLFVVASYWMPGGLDLSSQSVRDSLIGGFVTMVNLHKDQPAVLMWAIGNELNAPWMYGNDDDLFSLIDEMAEAAHSAEGSSFHPVTTPLADSGLIDTLCERDPQMLSLDVWSVQVYRGASFGSLFSDYAACSNRPLVITEYGIDAYDDRVGEEYEEVGAPYQAIYAASLWNEIVTNSSVCSGGSIMSYADEWWKGKHGQEDHPGCPEDNAAFHSACGYPAGAHPDGYANEEWWGVVRPVDNGSDPDIMQPRAVYYTLQALWFESKVYQPLVVR